MPLVRLLSALRLLAPSLLTLTIVSACSLQRAEAPPAGATPSADLLKLEAWEARGRIAIKSDTGGGQGDLRWEQEGAASSIRVSGPFGAGAWDIRWDPQSLSVTSKNGEFSRAYTGADAAEQFLTEQLGWAFPAVSTRYWLLGLPDPAYPAAHVLGLDGALAGFEQNGWSVSYERFVQQDGMRLPAKLTVENEQARLRLVIDRWCLAARCP